MGYVCNSYSTYRATNSGKEGQRQCIAVNSGQVVVVVLVVASPASLSPTSYGKPVFNKSQSTYDSEWTYDTLYNDSRQLHPCYDTTTLLLLLLLQTNDVRLLLRGYYLLLSNTTIATTAATTTTQTTLAAATASSVVLAVAIATTYHY